MKIDQSNQIKIGQFLVLASALGVITSPPLANVFIGLTLVWGLLFKVSRRNISLFLLSTPGYYFFGFVLILVISLIYGIADKQQIFSELWGWRKIIMLPIATSFFLNEPDAKKNIAEIFWKISLFFAAYSFIEFFFFSKNGILLRNYVTQSLIFSIAILILFNKLLNENNQPRKKYFYSLGILFFLGNIACISLGRSSYVALIVMIISCISLYPSITRTKRIYSGILAVSIAITVLFTVPASKNRIGLAYQEIIASQSQPEASSTGLRIIFWKTTLNMIPKNIVWGVGTGGFEDAYKKEVLNKTGPEATITGDPHNQYMKILVEQGLIGLIIFILLLLSLAKQRSAFSSRLIGLCTLSAWCVTSLTNAHFSTFNEGQFIWIWLGIFLAPDTSKN